MSRTANVFLFILIITAGFVISSEFFDFANALTIPVGIGPVYIAIDENTNTIFSVNQFLEDVTVIDGNANTILATIAVGASPSGAEFIESVNLLYVLNQGSSSISIIDPTTNTVVQTIPNIPFPFGQELDLFFGQII